MIDRGEILDIAGELSLRPDIVEKDYILGWLLAGIAQHQSLGPAWVFKGGTCLKKCYFDTYRFSEDLDFTVEDEDQLGSEFLHETFNEAAAWIYDRTAIEIPVDQLRFKVYRNKRNKLNCEGRVYYRGPLQRSGSLPRIKIDLTADERLVLPPDNRSVTHPYTDKPDDGNITVRCYAFEEVFGNSFLRKSQVLIFSTSAPICSSDRQCTFAIIAFSCVCLCLFLAPKPALACFPHVILVVWLFPWHFCRAVICAHSPL